MNGNEYLSRYLHDHYLSLLQIFITRVLYAKVLVMQSLTRCNIHISFIFIVVVLVVRFLIGDTPTSRRKWSFKKALLKSIGTANYSQSNQYKETWNRSTIDGLTIMLICSSCITLHCNYCICWVQQPARSIRTFIDWCNNWWINEWWLHNLSAAISDFDV